MTRISEHRRLDLLMMALVRPNLLLGILFWRVLGKRLRARGRLEAAISGLPFTMERKIQMLGRDDVEAVEGSKRSGAVVDICVHLHVTSRDDRAAARSAVRSLVAQSCKPLKIILTYEDGAQVDLGEPNGAISDPKMVSNRMTGLRAAVGEAQALGAHWVVPCDPVAPLTQHALAAYLAFAIGAPKGANLGVLFGDTSERANAFSRNSYWLKPQWDARMFLSQDYITQGCALAVEPALAMFEGVETQASSSLYELVLRMSETFKVQHLNRVVARLEKRAWQRGASERVEAVQKTLGECGRVSQGAFGTVRVQWSVPRQLPTVSVIVATRDRVELLRTCVEGVLYKTDYPSLDLIIADNESVEPETLAYMDEVSQDPRVQVVRWPHPFNYSAINNFAATHAHGEYLCLLNNDIEVIGPDWLTEMVREAVQPGVGAVGARLLYPDRSIQHAGVAVGIGNAAGHAHRALPEGKSGYYAQALITRGASAVTGACLLVRKDHFDAIEGLDEKNLAVAYNDVDLCLKLRELGLVNIYTPAATLIHHESKSRGLDFAPEHLERYMRELKVLQDRWDTQRVVDPWHHRDLDRGNEVYSRPQA